MDLRTYGYHCSKHVTRPKRSGTFNIKGLELEISDCSAGPILDEMIRENILIAPSNETENHICNIAIEDDGSVYKELIFRACSNRKLLEQVKIVEEYLKGKISNNRGTSCHIHMNKKYIQQVRNLNTLDIVKSAEFLAPILYAISGRDNRSISWAKSIIRYAIDINDDDLFKRASIIDNLDDVYDERYNIINVENSKTLELRIFSNYYNFNSDIIKYYLDTTDFIIDFADFMKDKSYKNSFNEAIAYVKRFFTSRSRINFYRKFNLDIFFLSLEERKMSYLNKQLVAIKKKFNKLNQITNTSAYSLDNAIYVIRALRDLNSHYSIPNIELNCNKSIDLDALESILIENINKQIEELENK